MSTEPRIDGERPWASLMEMARINATPKGGVCRLALTDLDLDREGGDLFVRWCEDAGCRVERCVSIVRDGAKRLGYLTHAIVSGAGHDACWMSRSRRPR